jgi:hypothetical protein
MELPTQVHRASQARVFGVPLKWLVPGFLILGVVYPIVMGISDSRGRAVSQAGQPAAPTRGLPVSATDLFAAYQANEVAADNRYKATNLLVTGDVDGIQKDAFGNVIVLLGTSNPFLPVHARVRNSEAQQAATLSKGMTVTVSCVGDGMILGSPVAKDCWFAQDHMPSAELSAKRATATVEANVLVIDFLQQPAGAALRYNGRYVSIPSRLRIIHLDPRARESTPHVVFRTDAGLEIRARFDEGHVNEIAGAIRNALSAQLGEQLPEMIPSRVFAEHTVSLSDLTCLVDGAKDGSVRLSDCAPSQMSR